MRRPIAVWVSGIGALAALDIWCAFNKTPGDSLSECARQAYRVDCLGGKVAFCLSWAALTAWLIPHIIRKKMEN